MISIPVKIKNGSTYYITILPAGEYTSLASKAQDYKTVTNIINFSLTTVSPNDITVSDLKAFRINGRTDSLAMGAGSTSVTGPFLKDPSYEGDPELDNANPAEGDSELDNANPAVIKNNIYYYTVTSYKTTTTWKIAYDSFTGNDLANIGVLLKKLIEHAHTHKSYSGPAKDTSVQAITNNCCHSSVIW